mmetsp:Transcript_5608/g.11193  ORF Transcript_5608/g.11193 Transcript_5608/m.11193 type:complete len:272 (-) Transcript_5608:602-1417(-)
MMMMNNDNNNNNNRIISWNVLRSMGWKMGIAMPPFRQKLYCSVCCPPRSRNSNSMPWKFYLPRRSRRDAWDEPCATISRWNYYGPDAVASPRTFCWKSDGPCGTTTGRCTTWTLGASRGSRMPWHKPLPPSWRVTQSFDPLNAISIPFPTLTFCHSRTCSAWIFRIICSATRVLCSLPIVYPGLPSSGSTLPTTESHESEPRPLPGGWGNASISIFAIFVIIPSRKNPTWTRYGLPWHGPSWPRYERPRPIHTDFWACSVPPSRIIKAWST